MSTYGPPCPDASTWQADGRPAKVRGEVEADPDPARASHGGHEGHADHGGDGKQATVVLHVGGLYRGSEKAVVETVLGRRPGVLHVEANPVAQTATVTYEAGRTSVA